MTETKQEAVGAALLLPRSANAVTAVLSDGRVSIQANDPTHASLLAGALQRMGNNVRQYGSFLVIHEEGQ